MSRKELRDVKPGFWFPHGTLNLGTLCVGRRREHVAFSRSLQHRVQILGYLKAGFRLRFQTTREVGSVLAARLPD